ncbi:hypothetical protein [uncultured Desulfovibrio sp.]|jgi:hypothetical protein|uniref:hypothetical protein n=1 Tax=uncultured Desulfovibrio sp. TaxID=167968 RepID=UPI002588F49D|nr:hypothetical protein [uncultured Desulfovibrio sp.]
MPKQRKFYFVLISEDENNKLYPKSFRGRELGEFLRLLDEMISSSISGQLGTDFGGLRIEGISRGSTCVSCCGTEKQLTAFTSVSNEINRGRYKTGKVRQCIEKIRVFSSSYSARLEFRSKRHGPALATLVPLTREQTTMSPLSISTETTLYGKISGINGVSKVRVTLSLLGFTGNADFVVTNKNDVREFCNRFGEIVGVNGTAEVRLPQREIVNFTFTSLTDYQEVPLSDAVQNIRNKFGDYFNGIGNIEELIREQRG